MSETLPGPAETPKPPDSGRDTSNANDVQRPHDARISLGQAAFIIVILGVSVTVAALGQSLWGLAVVLIAAAALLGTVELRGRRSRDDEPPADAYP